MKDCNCIFCKIANGEIPSNTVYEDEYFRAILDLSPAAKGHTLILPKEHFANLYELDDEYAKRVMPVAKMIAMAAKKALNADGVNLVQNNEAAAGQTVPHFHLHVIPRHEGDNALPLWTPGQSDPEEQKEIAAKIGGEL
ncbi:MAG: HIT family protein [Eubacteriales bacterium]|nr:HIT family protein [Eubacteriales bacterium]